MTTTEGNKLIAEFMDLKFDPDYHDGDKYIGAAVNIHGDNDFYEAQYHSSWDWLMPMVEKIESIEISKGHNPVVTIETGYCVISDNGEDPIIENQIDNKIECVWQTVVEFIQWYNNHLTEGGE